MPPHGGTIQGAGTRYSVTKMESVRVCSMEERGQQGDASLKLLDDET